MNQRFLSVILFAFIVSAIASFGLYKVVTSRMDANKSAPTTPIVAASKDLGLGTLLKAEDIKMVDWPGDVPPQAIRKPEDAIGRGIVGNMVAGEPILESRLAMRGAGAGMAAMIPKGMRAMAVRVNEIVGVAGFVVPGMRVDLIINAVPPTGAPANSGNMAKILLQNIEILSAGQNIQKDAEGKPIPVPVINILVTPDQAEMLSLVTNDARIQLVLRNPMDTEVAVTQGTSMGAILSSALGGKPVPPPTAAAPAPRRAPAASPRPAAPVVEAAKPAPPPQPIVIEVITGSARRESRFQGATGEEEKKQ